MASTHAPRFATAKRTLIMVAVLGTIGGIGVVTYRQGNASTGVSDLSTITVRKIDLSSTVRVPGEVDSSEKTTIECEIERLRYRNAGVSITASGSSEIIELVPDGTEVRQGDIICRLNSAEYEELVRQQAIEVEEDRAKYMTSKLDLESLEISLQEYRDGQLEALKQQFMGQIALAEADVERQKDRLIWSERMVEIGYMPLSRFTQEQQIMQQAELTLSSTSLAYENLLKYTAPKQILNLESQVENARTYATMRSDRLRREEEQLARYQSQLEKCTIRAPHDGLIIYASATDDSNRIELGATVRERQELFYLPDLSKMEIDTTLHESVVTRVRVGLPARIRIESLPGVELEGEVLSVSPLPISQQNWRQANDVKNYSGRVVLHTVPDGLMPGMTAQVEILTANTPDALVIPPQSMEMVNGRSVCYVALENHVERRAVTIGDYHPDMLEVTQGLAEGERVIYNPSVLDPKLVTIIDNMPAIEEPYFPTPASPGMMSEPNVATTVPEANESETDAMAISNDVQPTL